MRIINRLLALYGTGIYLPASGISRHLRRISRRLRGRHDNRRRRTSLPTRSWRQCVPRTAALLFEPKSANGNVRLSELSIIARFAAHCEPGTYLFEIGTYDGRTTLNLALNAPETCRIITLDLPSNAATRYEVVGSERQYIEKPVSGQRLISYYKTHPELRGKIELQSGDSATHDYEPYVGSCSLVFVDGSHAYEYVKSDTATAVRLLKPGGVIIWHDYGVWEGVTRALEELERHEQRGLTHIAGTSLVCWRSPVAGPSAPASA